VAAGFDPFTTVVVTRRDWGVEAVVSNFDEERLRPFCSAREGAEVEVDPLSLEEIFVALLGDEEAKA
jgi:hypothetical protein